MSNYFRMNAGKQQTVNSTIEMAVAIRIVSTMVVIVRIKIPGIEN